MKLLFGHGYLGSRVAARWREAGHNVAVVTRSEGKAAELAKQGYRTLVADVTDKSTLRDLPDAESVVFAVGFDRRGSQSIGAVYAGGVRNVLAALPAGAQRFIYISTTGVYGNAGGEWIDEQTPPNAEREGGAAAWAAEQELRAHPLGQNAVILRLAGIYGPGRIPFLDELRRGEPIAAASEGYLNLIHVDDAARCAIAAEDPTASGLYCVSDGNPPERAEFYREVARLVGASEPRFVAPDPGSPRAARAAGSKRVRNDRLLGELRVNLRCPSYREGLAAILGDLPRE